MDTDAEGLRFTKPIAVCKVYHKIEERFTMFTRTSAIEDRIMPEISEK